MESKKPKEIILELLTDKYSVKRLAFDNTQKVFEKIKIECQKLASEYNNELQTKGNESLIQFKDKGQYDAELQMADDLLVFSFHSNIFNFDKSHNVWKSSYLHTSPNASFCGVINIYNFLSDSFKFNRQNDVGYLVARIYVNKDNHYFVEGKRQLGFLYNDFINAIIDDESIRNIIESTILFTLDFDLLVPDYNSVSTITVAQMNENINNTKIQTAKRLGFKFSADTNEI
jgi:hypothetical protein